MLKRLKFVDRVIHTSMGGGVLAQVHMNLTKIHKNEFKMSKSSKEKIACTSGHYIRKQVSGKKICGMCRKDKISLVNSHVRASKFVIFTCNPKKYSLSQKIVQA
jgi:hypothetical protein